MLDHDAAEERPVACDPADGIDDVIDRSDVLATERHRHPDLSEEAAPGALEREGTQLGRRSVHWDLEREGKVDLVLGDVPRLDERRPIAHVRTDRCDQVGPIEELRRDGPRRPVVDLDEADAGTG